MGLFRRLLRREDAYDDLDTGETPSGSGDSGDLNDAFADDYEDEEPGGALAGTVSKVLAVLVVVGLFGAVILYAYSWTTGAPDQRGQDVPVVEAEPGPEKVKPEDPGGMDVPYQDQLVLNQSEGAEQGETLLPPPEAPNTTPTRRKDGRPANGENSASGAARASTGGGDAAGERVARGEATRSAEDAAPEDGRGTAREREGGSAGGDSGSGADSANGAETVPRPRDKPDVPDPPADEDEPADDGRDTARAPGGETATPTDSESGAAGEGGILIQLAAFQKRANAETAWERIRDKHRNLLGNQKLQLQRVRIPEKGMFWRVRTGPFPNRATAADLCGQLKDRGQPCLVMEE